MARLAPPQVEFVYIVLGGDFPGNNPPYAKFRSAGINGYLWNPDDPNFTQGMVNTKNVGAVAGLWIVPRSGESGAAFGARAAKAVADYVPVIAVLQIEEFGKGVPSSPGWNWNEAAAAAFDAAQPNVPAAVNVLPLQDDFNYGAWTRRGVRIWPECYDGAMNYFNAATVAQRVVANGVPRDMIRPVVPSNSWAAWIADIQRDSRTLFAIFRADQISDAALGIVAPFLGGTPPPPPLAPVTPPPPITQKPAPTPLPPPPAPAPVPPPVVFPAPVPLPPPIVTPKPAPAPIVVGPPIIPPPAPAPTTPPPIAQPPPPPPPPPDPDFTVPDPKSFEDTEPDDYSDWGIESDLDDALFLEDEVRQLGENDPRVLARSNGGYYRVIGIPGCGSHSPPGSCWLHSLSAAEHCAAGDAPCNWQSCNAVDIRLPAGTKLTPCARGKVSERFGWGLMEGGGGRFAGYRLHVEHPGGWLSFYTHLMQLPSAHPGDIVGPNTLLGYSGVANGVPHLHFAVTPPRDPRLLWTRTFLRATGGSRVPPPTQVLPGIPGGSGRPNDHPLAEQAWHTLMETIGPKRAGHTSRVRAATRGLRDAIK